MSGLAKVEQSQLLFAQALAGLVTATAAGPIQIVSTTAVLATTTIGDAVTGIIVLGTSTVGDGGQAEYFRSTGPANPPTVVTSEDGAFWRIIRLTGFGAVTGVLDLTGWDTSTPATVNDLSVKVGALWKALFDANIIGA